MVYLKLSEDHRPAPTPLPSEGMVVNGTPKPTLGLDHLGGWGRLGATIGIAVAVPAVPTLVYGALYYVGRWAGRALGDPPNFDTNPGRFVAYPMMGAVVVFLGALAVRAVGAAVVEATKWIREGFEVDAKRRALREPGTPGVGQVSIADPQGGELSLSSGQAIVAERCAETADAIPPAPRAVWK